MKKILLFTFLILFASIGVSNADQYVPEFDKMQIMRCEITETIYNEDNTQVSQSDYHRLLRLDDQTSTIYVQKERPSRIYYYGNDKVQYKKIDTNKIIYTFSINKNFNFNDNNIIFMERYKFSYYIL